MPRNYFKETRIILQDSLYKDSQRQQMSDEATRRSHRMIRQ